MGPSRRCGFAEQAAANCGIKHANRRRMDVEYRSEKQLWQRSLLPAASGGEARGRRCEPLVLRFHFRVFTNSRRGIPRQTAIAARRTSSSSLIDFSPAIVAIEPLAGYRARTSRAEFTSCPQSLVARLRVPARLRPDALSEESPRCPLFPLLGAVLFFAVLVSTC